jgi:hypothetical protein
VSRRDGQVAAESRANHARSETKCEGRGECSMSPEQDILAALRALAEADHSVEASPELEVKMRRAFRRRVRERKIKRIVVWSLAAAAALIAMLVAYEPRPQQESAAVPQPKAPEKMPLTHSIPVVSVPVRNTARVRRKESREVMTDFFPLVDDELPMERGQLVRVSLSAAAMQAVGLPVREDRLSERVQADVLVSEEGLATAIRFVKYSQ